MCTLGHVDQTVYEYFLRKHRLLAYPVSFVTKYLRLNGSVAKFSKKSTKKALN